jgi:hypothetical protein
MRRSVSAVLLCVLVGVYVPAAVPQAAREATIEPETRARIVLQSQLSSKLNEPGDPISAVLEEPIYVNGELVLPRGTEFHGRVTQATSAGRGQKNGQIAIIFEQIRMSWGDVPAAVALTAIDDWSHDEKMKANDEGKVSGSRSGERTAKNVERGATIGGDVRVAPGAMFRIKFVKPLTLPVIQQGGPPQRSANIDSPDPAKKP